MPSFPQLAAGAFVEHNDRVLLIQRGRPPAQHEWALPGGKVLPGESLADAVEREVLEESGIGVRVPRGEGGVYKPVYTFENIVRDHAGDILFHYVVIDLAAEYVSGEPKPGDDAEDAGWFTREELSVLHLNHVTERFLRERGWL